ncbi:MAG: beta-glucuronidase [Sedimentisphaeraceae bacterium JB056]
MLYPQENERREVKDLAGIWRFKLDRQNVGLSERWYESSMKDTIDMPVPSSYNDLTQDVSIRDYVGNVWYEYSFYIPERWKGRRVVIRLGSVTHHSKVWLNGNLIAEHKGGFLPFEGEITDIADYGSENRITVLVNNELDEGCLPRGRMKRFDDDYHPDNYVKQEVFFDFFNYAGIHRPVKVYTTNGVFVKDIGVTTDVIDNVGRISFKVLTNTDIEEKNIHIELVDEEGTVVAEHRGTEGIMNIDSPNLWQPGNAYLYTLKTYLYDNDKNVIDVYNLRVGIRTVEVEGDKFLINGEPFYFKGFGKHEDSELRGRGLDNVVNVKDFNLLEWIGANSFRTSHYPYSEEILNMADERGIVIIGESPAVGMRNDFGEEIFTEERFNGECMKHHIDVMQEMIDRDKNHPSIVMWSIANEPSTWDKGSVKYFKKIADKTRYLDSSRPLTLVFCSVPEKNGLTPNLYEAGFAEYVDVICLNRYFSWYTDSGSLDLVEFQFEKDLTLWHKRFEKPILITEYGVDALAGFHEDPPVLFTEEYQIEFLKACHRAFDKFDFVIGEHVWNFADFATEQGITRVVGNKKGIFTRQRKPKSAAFLLKERWSAK